MRLSYLETVQPLMLGVTDRCRGRSLDKFEITTMYLTLSSSKKKDLLLLSGRNFKILLTNNVLF